jgi:hypothetical protein
MNTINIFGQNIFTGLLSFMFLLDKFFKFYKY